MDYMNVFVLVKKLKKDKFTIDELIVIDTQLDTLIFSLKEKLIDANIEDTSYVEKIDRIKRTANYAKKLAQNKIRIIKAKLGKEDNNVNRKLTTGLKRRLFELWKDAHDFNDEKLQDLLDQRYQSIA